MFDELQSWWHYSFQSHCSCDLRENDDFDFDFFFDYRILHQEQNIRLQLKYYRQKLLVRNCVEIASQL